MASLKCSNCGEGIHYHDEPNGIEYKAISKNLWNLFKDTDKPISRYLLDGNDDFLCIWKCLKCGCLHAFQAFESQILQAYIAKNNNDFTIPTKKFIVFDDYLFEEIAENGLTAKDFEDYKIHNTSIGEVFYAFINDKTMVLCDFDNPDKIIKVLSRIKIME